MLRKIVEANHTDWDKKLHSTLWGYRTNYKTSIKSTPFGMAFRVEAAMPTEFIVMSLYIEVGHKLNEKVSEQVRVKGLLRFKEERLNSLRMLEHEQWVRKAFVD